MNSSAESIMNGYSALENRRLREENYNLRKDIIAIIQNINELISKNDCKCSQSFSNELDKINNIVNPEIPGWKCKPDEDGSLTIPTISMEKEK